MRISLLLSAQNAVISARLQRQQLLHVSSNPRPEKGQRQTERKEGNTKIKAKEEDTKASSFTVNTEGSESGTERTEVQPLL